VWIERPNPLRNKLDTTPDFAPEHPKPVENPTTVWIISGLSSNPKHNPPFKAKSLPEVKPRTFVYPSAGGKPLPREDPQPRANQQERVNPQPERTLNRE
jgi:hypothetical protein